MADIERLLRDSGAILKGHFKLSSGRHSDTYFEKFRLLENPHILSELCAEISSHFVSEDIALVAGPTTGGIIIAFEVARQMSKSAVYIEREGGKRILRRAVEIPRGTRVLVVDDVLTTGTSVLEVLGLLRSSGAVISGVAALVDRSESPVDFGAPFFAVGRVDAQTYAPDELPESLKKIPVTEPGTRNIP